MEQPNNARLWNSLEVAKLFCAILTPLLILGLAVVIDNLSRDAQLRDVRRDSIAELSELINGRLIRASLFRSALERYAAGDSNGATLLLPELLASKQHYDDAVSNWNTSRHANLLLVREVVGDDAYGRIAQVLDTRLVTSAFRPLGRCLNTAYENAISERNSDEVTTLLSSADGHLESAAKCGYEIVEGLHLLTNPVSISAAPSKDCPRDEVISHIESSCPLTDRTPALCSLQTTTTPK